MKNYFFILLIIFGQAMLAQKFNGFYVEPLINVKTTVFTKKELPATLTTKYFEIKPNNQITPIGFAVGLNLGFSFKNNDKLQLGVFQDESLSGIIFTGTSFNSVGTNSSSDQVKYISFGGVMTKNFNLLYKRNLLNFTFEKSKKQNYINIFFNIGLTYFYKPNNGLENLTGVAGTSFYTADSSKVTLEEKTWVFPLPFKYSFKFNTGIDFTFGNKHCEWFSFNVSYISNISKSNFYSFTSTNISVTDKNNSSVINYTYYITARGNGIYYQISRRFYPFKWYYTRQQKKIDEYKE